MAQHILHVEDDARIRAAVAKALSGAGWSVTTAGGVAEARSCLTNRVDLVLLDLGLPDGDGIEYCRELRAGGDATAIIVITARDALDDRIRGLDAGADDYIVKPFDVGEMLARVRSVLRRSGPANGTGAVHVGDLWADSTSRRAGCGESELKLTPTEFDLLQFLLKHPGRVWTRDHLLERVWGLSGGVRDSRIVDLTVTRLRKKIEADPSTPRYLATVWGVGYRLNDELT